MISKHSNKNDNYSKGLDVEDTTPFRTLNFIVNIVKWTPLKVDQTSYNSNVEEDDIKLDEFIEDSSKLFAIFFSESKYP
eukprot:3960995-Ditylum_brightwellii.AAC.1